MERRLTTIVSADVEGHSLLAAEDESERLTALDDLEAGIFAPLAERSGGRIIKHLSEGFLAEFGSVVNAVSFATALQQAFEHRNAGRRSATRDSFRVGIDLWDMPVDGDSVFGDGVSVATRLRAGAEPDSILISETVHQHVHRHLPLIFEDAGLRQLKDAPGLIPTFRVLAKPNPQPQRQAGPAYQASIAVLPFVNLSGDPEQSYLSDGVTEEIIKNLSGISALFVVSRDEAFSCRGSSETLNQLAVRLGVQYLLQGSLRKVEERVRISAQLIDGHSDQQLWSERYDRSFDDIMQLQNDVSEDVLRALHLSVLPKERETLNRRLTYNSEAYRFYLMGRSYFHRSHTRRFLRLGRQMFQRALEIEPDYAAAHAGLADCNAHLLEAGDFTVDVKEISAHSDRALALDPSLAEAHASKGLALYTDGFYEEARVSFERALELQPDLFEANYFYARNCFNLGQFGRAADLFGRAAKLKKDDFRSLGLQSMCFQSLAQLSEARAAARSALARTEVAVAERPDEADALSFGAGLLAFLGEYKRTKDWAERAAIIEPDDFYINYNVACAYALLGAKEEAIERLERIMGPPTPRSQQQYMVHDSDLDPLHSHPRFQKLLKTLGL